MRFSWLTLLGTIVVAVLVVSPPAAGAITNPFLTLNWTRMGSTPVVAVGPIGAWDDHGVIVGVVLPVSGLYHLFYTGANATSWGIGHATSSDGIHWTKDPGNPILRNAQSPVVLHESGVFKMWWVDPTTARYSINYATSVNGTAWTQYPANPVLTVSSSGWDSALITTGAILHDASGYRLWYTGTADHVTFAGGLATSPDGITWTKYPGNPVLRPGPLGGWTSGFVTPCTVFSDGTTLALWFVGGAAGAWQLGVAVSEDGTNWTGGAGPVLSPVSGSWDSTMISRASLVRVGDILSMWYTGANITVQQTGLAEAPYPGTTEPWFQLHWNIDPENPVLTAGPAGSWDGMHVVGGPVLFVNGAYRTWYVGSGTNTVWGTGTATSTDGIHWTKDAGNPIIPYDGGSQVVYENHTYKMWYTYAAPDAYAVPWQIRYATSTDGVKWTQVVNWSVLNVTAGAWDSGTLNVGPVLHDASGYRMWYGATADGMRWSAGLATSPDGVHWTKYAGNPIIVPPLAGNWDDFRVHPSSILVDAGQLVMWYVSDDTSLVQRIGVANSADGIHWTAKATPVLDVGANGSWDAGSLSRPFVLRRGNDFQMWFTGINTPSGFTGHWQVGYASTNLSALQPPGPTLPPGPATLASFGVPSLLLASTGSLAGAGVGAATYAVLDRSRRRP